MSKRFLMDQKGKLVPIKVEVKVERVKLPKGEGVGTGSGFINLSRSEKHKLKLKKSIPKENLKSTKKELNIEVVKNLKGESLIFNQFFGIGDILFIEPIMRKFFQNGNRIILPVLEKFMNLQPYFPYINFIDKDKFDLDYERRDYFYHGDYIVLPMRWSREFFMSPLDDTMRNKYLMVDMDLDQFRSLSWLRHRKKEDELFNLLGLSPGEKFNLINTNFHTFSNSKVRIEDVKNDYRNIEMDFIPGFTMLDWTKIIEEASTIHTANTSILFMLEALDLKAEEIHLYSRNVGGRDFNQTSYLYSKNYILHK